MSPKVPSLPVLGFGLSQVQGTHSATKSAGGNLLKCWFDQQVQLKSAETA